MVQHHTIAQSGDHSLIKQSEERIGSWSKHLALLKFRPTELVGVDDANPKLTSKKPGRKPGTQKENLAVILDEIEAWSVKNNYEFDRYAMPGPLGDADKKGSFHWLCAKLNPFNFQKGHKAFKGYRNGVCKLASWAKESDIYLQAMDDIAQKLQPKILPAKAQSKGR